MNRNGKGFLRWLQDDEADSPAWRSGAWGWLWTIVGVAMLVAIVIFTNNTRQGYLAGGVTILLVIIFSGVKVRQDRRSRSASVKFAHLNRHEEPDQ